jgi:hypothetical protein
MIVAVLAFVVLYFMQGGMISIPSKFSLLKLLIMLTLVAVVLGVLAYAVRN